MSAICFWWLRPCHCHQEIKTIRFNLWNIDREIKLVDNRNIWYRINENFALLFVLMRSILQIPSKVYTRTEKQVRFFDWMKSTDKITNEMISERRFLMPADYLHENVSGEFAKPWTEFPFPVLKGERPSDPKKRAARPRVFGSVWRKFSKKTI